MVAAELDQEKEIMIQVKEKAALRNQLNCVKANMFS